jgi:ATP-dependent DNA helicase RecG
MSTVGVEAALGLPPGDRATALSSLPEDQWFDRKSARISPQKLAESLIGFGNAEGGTVIVGVSDGDVEGTDGDVQRRNAFVRAGVELVSPPLRVEHSLIPCVNTSGQRDHLLCLRVEPGDTVHSSARDEVFLRVGDSTFRLSFGQRQELLFDKGQAVYESHIVPGTDIEDVDGALVRDYVTSVGSDDPNRLLHARGLLRDNTLTVAGYLLFGRHPQDRFPQAQVRVSRFIGRERGTGARQRLQEEQRVEGPLPDMLFEAARLVDQWQPRRRALGRQGRFETVSLIPQDAWLEALVNAVVHRSYSISGDHIRVDLFDDRIEVSSPGRFPGIVHLKDPRAVHRFARNPRIARVLADLKFGQEFGEGIARMYEEMRIAGLEEPIYQQSSGGVRVLLSGHLRDQEIDQAMPETGRLIIETLREAGRLGTGELAEVMGVSRPTAVRHLNALRDLGLIEWRGKSPRDPRAFWTLPKG